MKKFLSLVLALVMTMSLVTVSAGAVDFTDDSSIKYEEAVDVISAAGVVGGYADGSFNPKGTLTRGAAAKILCNLMLGTKAAAALKAAEAPFSDVPVDNVFSAYIAFCANEGIISGYADGTFKPAATLTGFAFMKMLLGAIGYDQSIEGFTGTNWAINVAKLGVAKDLNKGIKDFDGTKYITREEAAQMAFKALTATMVEYKDKSTVTIGDIVIANSSEAKDVTVEKDTLMKKNFEDMDDNPTFDAYGRPATEWTFDDELVGVYGDSADYTIVASKDKNIGELIEKEKLNKVITDYESDDDTNVFEIDVFTGEVLEMFVDEKVLENFVIYHYEVAQIDEVVKADEDIDEDAIADGAKYIVTFKNDGDDFMDGEEVYDIQLKGFDAKTYVDGAWVMFPVIGDDAVADDVDFEEMDETLPVYVDTVIASSISGKVTAETDDYIKVDGKKYTVVNGDVPALGAEGSFFVDPNGYVIGFTEKEDDKVNVGDVLFVAGSYDVTAEDNFGVSTTTYYLQLVDTKGEVQNVAVAKVVVDEDEEDDVTIPSGSAFEDVDELDDLTGMIVTVKAAKKGLSKVTIKDKINSDYSVATGFPVDDLASDAKYIDDDDHDYRLNKDTTYIAVEGAKGDLETTVKVGGVSVSEESEEDNLATVIYKTVTGNNVAVYVFLKAELGGNSSDEVLFISEDAVKDAEKIQVGEDEIACWSIEAITLAGKTKTILVEEDSESDDLLGENGFFTVKEIDDDDIYTLEVCDDVFEVDDEDGDPISSGVAEGTFAKYYETTVSFGKFEDVEAKNAAFVDLHDTEDYAKAIKSLAALKTADKYGYDVNLLVYVDEDAGAQLIVVESVAAREED